MGGADGLACICRGAGVGCDFALLLHDSASTAGESPAVADWGDRKGCTEREVSFGWRVNPRREGGR